MLNVIPVATGVIIAYLHYLNPAKRIASRANPRVILCTALLPGAFG